MRGLQSRLKAVGETEGFMRELGLRAVAEQKRLVKRKTGTTGRSIRLVSYNADEAITHAGGAGAFLEFGTRPHVIVPRRAKVLRFPAHGVKTTLGGRVTKGAARKLGNAAYRFSRRVRHPGTKPQPFMVPGAKKAADEMGVQYIIDAWNAAD